MLSRSTYRLCGRPYLSAQFRQHAVVGARHLFLEKLRPAPDWSCRPLSPSTRTSPAAPQTSFRGCEPSSGNFIAPKHGLQFAPLPVTLSQLEGTVRWFSVGKPAPATSQDRRRAFLSPNTPPPASAQSPDTGSHSAPIILARNSGDLRRLPGCPRSRCTRPASPWFAIPPPKPVWPAGSTAPTPPRLPPNSSVNSSAFTLAIIPNTPPFLFTHR